MYKHQQHLVHSLRESWQDLSNEEPATCHEVAKSLANRRGSDPITIFSAGDTDLEAPHRGILPGHVGGVFAGQGCDEMSTHATTMVQAIEFEEQSDEMIERSSLTSLGSALDEVLESVDQTTAEHERSRSDSRIQDWLGQQSKLHGERKRKYSLEERKRIKGLTERIMRDLLGIDKSVLDILFRAKSTSHEPGAKLAEEMEVKIWKRWIELTKRDTASLSSSLRRPPPPSMAPSLEVPGTRVAPEVRPGLEKIPWGVPEDSKDDVYWDEELSIPMIFRYLKSFMSLNSHRPTPAHATEETESEEHAKKHLKTTQPIPTQSHSTVTSPSTMHTLSTIGPRLTLSRQALSKSARLHLNNQRDRSRSRTSRSSSYQAVSLRTGTCSVASVRRSALGSNFWDMGSMGGASISSRDVGGHWSVSA